MAKTHKRVLSLILSLVMVLSLLPIQALAAVSISCTASDGAVITVTGDIPENAVVTAVPVPVELEGMKTLGAYDINITVDGAAWQPESPVEVSIESPAFEGYEELSVFHVDTDQALDYIDQYFGFLEQIMNFIKGLFSRKISSDEVSFMAEHFSIYAVGVPYVATYNFYDGDGTQIQNATQILKAGDEVQLPAAPAGDGIFQGWYIDDTLVDDSYQVPELSEDKTYSVYPKFDGVYYVTFYDTTGTTVVATIPVDTTGSAVVGDAINTVEPVLEAGKILVGWSTMQGSDANFTASTPVTGNISVYPVLRDGVVVTFDSRGGSPSVTTVTAEADGTVAPPSDPTRSGFHFDGWYTDPTGGDEVDFTYYRPEANEILYAHWTASDTSYTIQYWAENADDKDYTYAAAETVNGTAGAAINLTQNQMNPSKLNRTDSAGFTYSHNDSEGKTVAGDGTTIVNVYFDRNTYTVKFWVQGSPEPTCGLEEHTHSWRRGCYKLVCEKWFMHSHKESCYDKNVVVCGKVEHTHTAACYGGVETDGDWYVWKAVIAKYGAYIGDQWPGSNWHIGKDSNTSQSFLSVMPLGGDDFYWHHGGTPGDTGSDKSSADYYVEALPGTAGTVTFDGKSFVWHHKDTARNGSLTITEEDFYDIAGFTQYKYTSDGKSYRPGHEGPDYDGAKFYYTRNSYTIDFYVDGDNMDSASVAYETAIGSTLDAKKPTTPPQPDYTFEGWYLDPECETPVPVDMTMSDGNLAVYGQWVPPVVEVNVYYTTASGQAVSAGTFNFGHVLLATDLEDVVKTAASATDHDVADFLGWYVQSGTGYAAYTFGSALTSDVTLYARWRGDTYTVTYQGSEGAPYADPGKYALGSEAKALTFATTGLTAPVGKEFSHWETADGTQVKPGETLSISGNVTLTAVYVDEVDVPTVTVTYNANGGKGDDVTTEAMPVNSLFMVKSDTECGFTNPGYRFIGWATEEGPVAEKDLIQPGKEMRADNDNGENILYAQWEKDDSQTQPTSYTVKHVVDGKEQTGDTRTYTDTAWINEEAPTIEIKAGSVDAKTYEGYKFDSMNPDVEAGDKVESGTVITLTYVKDESQTKTLSYTVEYYKDGVKVDADTQTVEEKVWINSTQTTLTVDKNNINTTDKYVGYALDRTDPAEILSTIESGSTIKVYYAKDVKGGGDDGEEGDTIPDKYQVFVKYEANAGGSLTGETYKAYDLRDAEGMATSVTLTFPTPVAETNYVFDGWTNPDDVTVDVTVEGTIMSGFVVDTTYTFTANFAKDDLVDPTEDEDPDKPGDGIADKYQVEVNYRAINGTVSFASTAVTKKDASGNPAENGTAKLTDAHIPTTTPNVGYILSNNPWAPATPVAGMEVKNGDTFTITYVLPHPYIPPVDPGTDIDDPDVPLADLPGLNTVDHYAYIAGYEDGTVRPNNNITRAEVATIFFRLFTDEYRETYWSTNNPFSDVAYTAWYNNAVSTTSNAGIIAGYPDGTFQPNNYITRAEFATIAARFLSEEYVGPDLFTDISGHWAAEYINRAANAGWINGYPDGSFRPNAYITRAEAMTLVNSMLGRMPHKDHMLENMVKWPDNPEAAWYYEAVQEATNGHDYEWYVEEEQRIHEIWTALQPNRDWAALEKEWSNAYSAPGGEVIG